MATAYIYLAPENAVFFPAAGFPQYTVANGSNFSVSGLAFSGTGSDIQECCWKFNPAQYDGSSSFTVDVLWYGTSLTSGSVVWSVSFCAVTPNTDTGSILTESFDTGNSITTAHPGTTAARLIRSTTTVPLANLDSATAGDEMWCSLFRSAGSASDTYANLATVTSVRISYEMA